MKTAAIIIPALMIATLSGCYTQLATHPGPSLSPSNNESDSSIPAQVDTIVTRDRETCIWTRNFFGEAILRCYKTTYDRDWYVYRDYPWWYREAPWYYDQYGRCPRYYYYDPDCGCCRYYYNSYRPGGSPYYGGGSSTPPPSSSPSSPSKSRRGRSYGIPQVSPAPGTTLPKEQDVAPTNQGGNPETPRSRRERGYGIPQNVPAEKEQPTPPLKKETPPEETIPAVPESTPAVTTPPPEPADTATTTNQPRRRSGRGW